MVVRRCSDCEHTWIALASLGGRDAQACGRADVGTTPGGSPSLRSGRLPCGGGGVVEAAGFVRTGCAAVGPLEGRWKISLDA